MDNQRKKLIVNLFGGPGSGKSSSAALVFGKCKALGINAEMAREYIKSWVWEGREVIPGDQIYLAAKQSRSERILFKDVDLIISDCPVMLSQFYEEFFDKDIHHCCRDIVIKHNQLAKRAGFEHLNIVINRVKEYNPIGRNGDANTAVAIDIGVKAMLDREGVPYITVNGNNDGVDKIVQIIREMMQ